MATYKVPQDVEAEDKLIGPFTFRQFIFLIVAAISLFVTVQLFRINPLLSLITLPLFVVFGTLGVYRRPDQPVEIYLLAVLRFYLKPHRRIWDQEGIMENVHITAPKRPIHQFTDGLSQTEVRSRLDKLARVMDSRGWSVKNVDINTPLGTAPTLAVSDRLIMPTQQVEPNEIHASDDMLDVYNNPDAHNVDQRMQATASQARQEAVEMMRQAARSGPMPRARGRATPATARDDDDDVSFSPYPSDMQQQVISPLPSSGQRNKARRQQSKPADNNDQHSGSLAKQVRESRSHTAGTTANTSKRQQARSNREAASTSRMTPPPSDAILRLANNSDLRVSTIASEAARIEALEDNQTIQLH